MTEKRMINKPHYKQVKTTQAAALFLQLNGGKMSYMKLIKLLYNADREAIKRWLRPITFDDYYSLDHGQIVSRTTDLLRSSRLLSPFSFLKRHIRVAGYDAILQTDPGRDHLSLAEIELINELNKKYENKDQFDMKDEHHKEFGEWINPHGSRIKTEYFDLLEAIGLSQEQINELITDFEELIILEELA